MKTVAKTKIGTKVGVAVGLLLASGAAAFAMVNANAGGGYNELSVQCQDGSWMQADPSQYAHYAFGDEYKFGYSYQVDPSLGCQTKAYFMEKANLFCQGKANPVTGKTGINTYKLKGRCALAPAAPVVQNPLRFSLSQNIRDQFPVGGYSNILCAEASPVDPQSNILEILQLAGSIQSINPGLNQLRLTNTQTGDRLATVEVQQNGRFNFVIDQGDFQASPWTSGTFCIDAQLNNQNVVTIRLDQARITDTENGTTDTYPITPVIEHRFRVGQE